MSLIGKRVIFLKDYQSIPGQWNSSSKDWIALLFKGEVLDKLKEYYLIKDIK